MRKWAYGETFSALVNGLQGVLWKLDDVPKSSV